MDACMHVYVCVCVYVFVCMILSVAPARASEAVRHLRTSFIPLILHLSLSVYLSVSLSVLRVFEPLTAGHLAVRCTLCCRKDESFRN